MPADSGAFWVLALLAAGMGGIFLWTDWNSGPSRALALCLMMIGLRLAVTPTDIRFQDEAFWVFQISTRVLETLSILFGIEWARRVGLDASAGLRRTVNVLFRVSQGIALLYGLMTLGYLLLAPEQASTDAEGLLRLHALQWAVFAPVLGTSILLASIALLMVRFTRKDPVESVRLRALAMAAPFLLGGLAVEQSLVPIVMAIGLLIFLSGSVRYLIIQGQRGQSMQQFLSPEVARMLSSRGVDEVMRRERRVISVIMCDLRGFTAYAGSHPSDAVMVLLERYYRLVGIIAKQFRGTIKDHAGDGMLILVGAPLPDREHALHAAQLALRLSQRIGDFLAQNAPVLAVGVGVATGETTIGAIRGAGRLEYAAVGTSVNLAARLCQRAAAAEVLIDMNTRDALIEDDSLQISACDPEPMKGFDQPVPVFSLTRGTA